MLQRLFPPPPPPRPSPGAKLRGETAEDSEISGRRASLYQGAYGKLAAFLAECHRSGCKTLPTSKYKDLIAAVEALSSYGEGQRATVQHFVDVSNIGTPAVGFLDNLGIVTGFQECEGGDAVTSMVTDCDRARSPAVRRLESFLGESVPEFPKPEGSATPSSSSSSPPAPTKISTRFRLGTPSSGDQGAITPMRVPGGVKVGSAMTYEIKHVESEGEGDEYNFPGPNSVRFSPTERPRSTSVAVMGTLSDCAKLLNNDNFNPSVFTNGRFPDIERRDMQLLMHMFASPFDLIKRYNIHKEKLGSWIDSMARQYMDHSYHNWGHALEVTQLCYHAVTTGAGGRFFNLQDILALFCSAIAHDVAHPGYTTAFLVRTRHELAMIYNDRSPTENMHSYRFFETLSRPNHDFLEGYRSYQTFREKVVAAILSTDMAQHFGFVDRFTTRVSQRATKPMVQDTKYDNNKKAQSKSDRRMWLEAFLHTADLGINFKKFDMQMKGVLNLEEEWFQQGDLERELGLPISPNSDRHKDSAARIQNFFLGSMVRPLLDPFSNLVTDLFKETAMKNLQDNIVSWEQAIAKHGSLPAAQLVPLLCSMEEGEEHE